MGPRTVKLTAKRDSHARSLVQLFANTVTYEETNDLSNAQFPSDENWELRIEHWPATCLQIFSGIGSWKSDQGPLKRNSVYLGLFAQVQPIMADALLAGSSVLCATARSS